MPSHHGLKGLGATGKYPDGVVENNHVAKGDDYGEIKIGILNLSGLVAIDFGKSLAWIGMTTKEARQVARVLNDMADTIDKKVKREEKENNPAGTTN